MPRVVAFLILFEATIPAFAAEKTTSPLLVVNKLTREIAHDDAKADGSDPNRLLVHFPPPPEAQDWLEPSDNKRLGLLYRGPDGVLIPIQRGDVRQCDKQSCEAVFDETFLVRDYLDEISHPDRWSLVVLESARLVERELGGPKNSKNKDKDRDDPSAIHLRLAYGGQSLNLKEHTNSTYNYAKETRSTRWGTRLELELATRGFVVSYSTNSVVLSTRGFFDELSDTSETNGLLSAGWRFRAVDWFQSDVQVFRFARSFVTGNTDEAILSTHYQAIGLQVAGVVTMPFFWTGDEDSSFRLAGGRLSGSFGRSLKGSANDTGSSGYARGSMASYVFSYWGVGYELYTSSSNPIANNWGLGIGFESHSDSATFQGEAKGNTVNPEGTIGKESWSNLRFWLSKELRF